MFIVLLDGLNIQLEEEKACKVSKKKDGAVARLSLPMKERKWLPHARSVPYKVR